MHRIVVAIDNADAVESALVMALHFGTASHADLHFIAAEPPKDIQTGAIPEQQRAQFNCLREDIMARCRAVGVRADFEVLSPWSMNEIAIALRRLGPELVVIGHRRPRSLMQRLLHVSLAKRLLDRTPCPLLVAFEP